MFSRQMIGRATTLALTLLYLTPVAAQADYVTTVSVDTSSLTTIPGSGYIDLQFNPNGLGSGQATAEVSGFTTDGSLSGAPTLVGSVTGALVTNEPVTFIADPNGSGLNDYTQAITFGNNLSFQLSLLGVDSSYSGPGAEFTLTLYDSNFSNTTLLPSPNSPSGSALTLDLNTASNSVSGNPVSVDISGSVTVTPSASAVPEPSSLVLVLTALPAGLLGLAGTRRRRKNGKRPASTG